MIQFELDQLKKRADWWMRASHRLLLAEWLCVFAVWISIFQDDFVTKLIVWPLWSLECAAQFTAMFVGRRLHNRWHRESMAKLESEWNEIVNEAKRAMEAN